MKYTVDLHLAYCRSRKGRQHDSPERVAECSTITSFQRFHYESAKLFIFRYFGNFDFGFIKIKHYKIPSFSKAALLCAFRLYLEYSSTISISFSGTSIASLLGSSLMVPVRAS